MVTRVAQVDQLLFQGDDGELYHYLPPKNKAELQQQVQLLFGLTVPDRAVCLEHQSPLDALAAAYFADAPVVVWKASRGLGGKTTLLAALSLLELLAGMNVTVLGGSGRQSQRVHEIEREAWDHTVTTADGDKVESPLHYFIPEEPTTWSTKTINGNKLVALTASTKSVRGPHPQRLRMDEVDEMKRAVYDAAMGQAMSRDGFSAQTTLSSTQQYPDGTMSYVMDLARQRGWPIYEWCYHETLDDNEGWLPQVEVDNKRHSVSEGMWNIEYELQEAVPEGRIFSAESLLLLFKPQIGRIVPKMGAIYEFEKPRKDALYATGVDWARDQDYTEITTLRYDIKPARLVAYEFVKDETYPMMVQRFERRLNRYGGLGIHDAVGVGSGLEDYVPEDVIDYKTKSRPELYSKYIMAVESGRIESPMVETLHSQHKFVRHIDIYGGQRGHPPDGMSALALTWAAVTGDAQAQVREPKKPGRIGRARGV